MLAESAGNTRHVTGDLPVIYRPVSMIRLAFLQAVPKLTVLLQGQLGWSVDGAGQSRNHHAVVESDRRSRSTSDRPPERHLQLCRD